MKELCLSKLESMQMITEDDVEKYINQANKLGNSHNAIASFFNKKSTYKNGRNKGKEITTKQKVRQLNASINQKHLQFFYKGKPIYFKKMHLTILSFIKLGDVSECLTSYNPSTLLLQITPSLN